MDTTTAGLKKAQLDLREPVKDGKRFKEGASLEVLTFDFNPKDYSMALQANWDFKHQKKPGVYPEFTGTGLRTLDFEMFLDATDDAEGDVSTAVRSLLATVRPTERSKSANTPFPPIVRFSWGSSEPFVGVVKTVSANFTLFRLSGHPVRATCKVSMQEYPPEPEKQNPTSGGLRSSRGHLVTLGDSLASIAQTEYGSPSMWRAIALVNELDDPFNLRIGQELLIPAAAEAAALV